MALCIDLVYLVEADHCFCGSHGILVHEDLVAVCVGHESSAHVYHVPHDGILGALGVAHDAAQVHRDGDRRRGIVLTVLGRWEAHHHYGDGAFVIDAKLPQRAATVVRGLLHFPQGFVRLVQHPVVVRHADLQVQEMNEDSGHGPHVPRRAVLSLIDRQRQGFGDEASHHAGEVVVAISRHVLRSSLSIHAAQLFIAQVNQPLIPGLQHFRHQAGASARLEIGLASAAGTLHTPIAPQRDIPDELCDPRAQHDLSIANLAGVLLRAGHLISVVPRDEVLVAVVHASYVASQHPTGADAHLEAQRTEHRVIGVGEPNCRFLHGLLRTKACPEGRFLQTILVSFIDRPGHNQRVSGKLDDVAFVVGHDEVDELRQDLVEVDREHLRPRAAILVPLDLLVSVVSQAPHVLQLGVRALVLLLEQRIAARGEAADVEEANSCQERAMPRTVQHRQPILGLASTFVLNGKVQVVQHLNTRRAARKVAVDSPLPPAFPFRSTASTSPGRARSASSI
eukprot:scaffold1282_cov251-Pinguiococcus_pyrenoidosus.AAC.37